MTVVYYYKRILYLCLENKFKFLSIPLSILFVGIITWQGIDKILGFIPSGFDKVGLNLRETNSWQSLSKTFPGIGKEFMPSLDEGSFLLMPTTMPHSGIEENIEVIRKLDMKVNSIPEVENVVGKWGRVNSALDPAPISMFENVINYKPEYMLDEDGRRMRFKVNKDGSFALKDGNSYNPAKETFRLIEKTQLIENKKGEYFRQWRDHIHSPDDSWAGD